MIEVKIQNLIEISAPSDSEEQKVAKKVSEFLNTTLHQATIEAIEQAETIYGIQILESVDD